MAPPDDSATAMVEQYVKLAAYNTWMNERIYTMCSEIDDDERKLDRGAFFGSIHGTLDHLVLADTHWLARFTEDPDACLPRDSDGNPIQFSGLDAWLYQDFAELRRQRKQTDAEIEKYVAGLKGETLNSVLSYETRRSGTLEHPLWWALTHFFNHQTHHRGQLTTLLSQLGRDPGVTDLIWHMRK